MPLTAKGSEIKAALTKEYGAAKGEHVLYAGKNAGTFTGIDALDDDAECDAVKGFLDSYRSDANKPGTNQEAPTYNPQAVQKAIEASPQKISGKEAKLIHALLKGRHDDSPDPARLRNLQLDAAALCDSVEKLNRRIDAYTARRADEAKCDANPSDGKVKEALAAMARLRATFKQGDNRFGTYGRNTSEAYDRWAKTYKELTGTAAPSIYD